MAYGFNIDKSKANVYTQEEINGMFKKVTVTGQISDGGTVGKLYYDNRQISVPSGYTPVGVYLNRSGCMVCGLQKSSNKYYIETWLIGSNAASQFNYTADVYCIKNTFVS